jgi:hypothetical protein
MSSSGNSEHAVASPIAAVTISLYPGGRIEIRPMGMMSAEVLQAVLLQVLGMVAAQVLQQVASPIVVAGGGVPRAD